jgi:hypothetical protein
VRERERERERESWRTHGALSRGCYTSASHVYLCLVAEVKSTGFDLVPPVSPSPRNSLPPPSPRRPAVPRSSHTSWHRRGYGIHIPPPPPPAPAVCLTAGPRRPRPRRCYSQISKCWTPRVSVCARNPGATGFSGLLRDLGRFYAPFDAYVAVPRHLHVLSSRF